jgi:hypothetical protein
MSCWCQEETPLNNRSFSAAIAGHINCLKIAYENKWIFDFKVYVAAAVAGRLECMEYYDSLKKTVSHDILKSLIIYAIGEKKHEVLKKIILNHGISDSYPTIEYIIATNNFSLFKKITKWVIYHSVDDFLVFRVHILSNFIISLLKKKYSLFTDYLNKILSIVNRFTMKKGSYVRNFSLEKCRYVKYCVGKLNQSFIFEI